MLLTRNEQFNDTLRIARKLKRRLAHELAHTNLDHIKIRKLKGQLSRKIEKLTELDGKNRIFEGFTPESWNE